MTSAGIAYDSTSIAAGRAVVYVPKETTNDQAQKIANATMLYICKQAGGSANAVRAANMVTVSDGVSIAAPNYKASEHPSGFATDQICSE